MVRRLWAATFVALCGLASIGFAADPVAKQASENKVTIYSNGIACFSRTFDMKAGENKTIVLPVKQEHAGDVLASLMLSGDLEVKEPASIALGQAQDSKLELKSSSVIESLATSLSGAEVNLKRGSGTPISGVLVGLDTQKASGGERKFLVVKTQQGLQRLPLDEISDLQFPDARVQAEIDRALAQNFRKLNPEATLVQLKVSARSDTKATLRYTVPVAAWKQAYRLRELPDGSYELEGHAIVDNNTAENWDSFKLAVATGQPITFSTDIAQVKIPRRRHIDLVTGEVQGGVEAAELAPASLAPMAPRGAADASPRARSPGAMSESALSAASASARTPAVQASEVADFSIFSPEKPVTITAGNSADIVIFRKKLDKAQAVLLYKAQDNPERPFRAVRFSNENDFSLGKGVCTVYLSGDTYGGSAILSAAKPKEEKLLVHALETGVRIGREYSDQLTKQTSVTIARGILVSQTQQSVTVTYRVVNSSASDFDLVIDHQSALPGSELTVEDASAKVEKIKGGQRVSIKIAGGKDLNLALKEKRLDSEQVSLGDNPGMLSQWIKAYVSNPNHALLQDEGLKAALALQEKIDAINLKLRQEEAAMKTLEARQESLRKDMAVAGTSSPQHTEWLNKLNQNRQKLDESQEKTQPQLQENLQKLQLELSNAVKNLTAKWQDK